MNDTVKRIQFVRSLLVRESDEVNPYTVFMRQKEVETALREKFGPRNLCRPQVARYIRKAMLKQPIIR